MEIVKWLNAELVSVNVKEKPASKSARAAIAERSYAKLVIVNRDVRVVIVMA